MREGNETKKVGSRYPDSYREAVGSRGVRIKPVYVPLGRIFCGVLIFPAGSIDFHFFRA